MNGAYYIVGRHNRGEKTSDPRVLLGLFAAISVSLAAIGLLLAVALLAAWFPSRRALSVDPSIALKQE
jgi:ABC-type lipoprotein release transport system permease subunit